jgi:hypothetical protein
MLNAGMPVEHIMTYFLPDSTPGERSSVAAGWTRSRLLQDAIKELQGDEWHLLSLDDRIQKSIDKHYSELAYFLYTHNYSDASGMEKTKSDTARVVLETKLAGNAGKNDPLSQFYSDLKAGKIKSLSASSPGGAKTAPGKLDS